MTTLISKTSLTPNSFFKFNGEGLERKEETSALGLHGQNDNTAMKPCLAPKASYPPPGPSLHHSPRSGDRGSRSPGKQGRMLPGLLGGRPSPRLLHRALHSLCLADEDVSQPMVTVTGWDTQAQLLAELCLSLPFKTGMNKAHHQLLLGP